MITFGLQRIDDLDQQVARIGDGRWQAFSGVHAHLQRRCRNLPPGQAYQAVLQRIGAAIDITHVPDQT
ncbi:hypothetical protein D3C79_1082570 [compost metagenome]